MSSITNLEASASVRLIKTSNMFSEAFEQHADSAIGTWNDLEAGASSLGVANLMKAALKSGEVKPGKFTYASDPMIKVHGLTGYVLLTFTGRIGSVSEHQGGSTFKNVEGNSVHLQGLVRRTGVKIFWETVNALPEGSKLKDAYAALEKAAIVKEKKAAADKKKAEEPAPVDAPVEAPVEEVVPVENLLASLESVLSALIVRQAELDASGWVRVDALRAMIAEIKITNVPSQRVA
jgi:hypothetical protein